MFLCIRVLIAADGVVTPAAVHAGGRPHELGMEQFHGRKVHITQQHFIGDQILKEIRARVGFLKEVGLEYLTLTRATGTLSGGEAQRIRLATQIGSGLVGVAYILDEPSICLLYTSPSPRD